MHVLRYWPTSQIPHVIDPTSRIAKITMIISKSTRVMQDLPRYELQVKDVTPPSFLCQTIQCTVEFDSVVPCQ